MLCGCYLIFAVFGSPFLYKNFWYAFFLAFGTFTEAFADSLEKAFAPTFLAVSLLESMRMDFRF
jgi:hypothetical protein